MRRTIVLAAAALAASGCSATRTKSRQADSVRETKRVESRYTGPKRRVGVVDFTNKSGYGQERLGSAAADILITELSKTGKFILVEREKILRLLDEQKLGASGIVESETAAEMGRILGLNAIVTGSISNFGVSMKESDYLIAQRKKQVASATVDVRVVDVETAKVLLADSGKGTAESSSGEILGMGTHQQYVEALEGDALRAAIVQLARNISSQINKKDWFCRVAETDGRDIYLDAGEESGLKIGQKLVVYKLGREIRDSRTGTVLGRKRSRLGRLRIREFFGANGAVAHMTDKDAEVPSPGDLVRLR